MDLLDWLCNNLTLLYGDFFTHTFSTQQHSPFFVVWLEILIFSFKKHINLLCVGLICGDGDPVILL